MRIYHDYAQSPIPGAAFRGPRRALDLALLHGATAAELTACDPTTSQVRASTRNLDLCNVTRFVGQLRGKNFVLSIRADLNFYHTLEAALGAPSHGPIIKSGMDAMTVDKLCAPDTPESVLGAEAAVFIWREVALNCPGDGAERLIVRGVRVLLVVEKQ
jgi:hypothetical protein